MPKSKTFHLVSLGCAKNTVDADSMGQLLNRAGYRLEPDPSQAEVLVVNTCGFIESARAESLQVLKELSSSKQAGQMLVAAGCLTQRYGAQVAQQVSGIDGILGTRRWMDIVEVVQKLRHSQPPQPFYHLPEAPTIGIDEAGVLRASLQGSSAFLKIADGCRRPCAFCAIPLIKGIAVSRPMPTLLAEARELQQMGVKEIILIAQDSTDYGSDLGLKDGLVTLLEGLVREVPQVNWLRILYAYPGCVSERLIEMMATQPQLLPYLDIPLQHAHPDILKRMQRPSNMDWVYRTLTKMRKTIPNLALRTTFIVGYPGESEAEFQTLLDFVSEMRFDRVGTFQFSFEPGTGSEKLGDPIPKEVKQERYDRLMTLQQQISLEINQSLVGKTMEVLVEGTGEIEQEGRQQNEQPRLISLGRTYRDAPEIDGLVFLDDEYALGAMLPVTIDGAMPYDLSGFVNPKIKAKQSL
jgi:ribosomal protein S12 methylthiotransferase